ncbi:hypothetical protein ACTXT7_008436 [Hymenolepis weldensis]
MVDRLTRIKSSKRLGQSNHIIPKPKFVFPPKRSTLLGAKCKQPKEIGLAKPVSLANVPDDASYRYPNQGASSRKSPFLKFTWTYIVFLHRAIPRLQRPKAVIAPAVTLGTAEPQKEFKMDPKLKRREIFNKQFIINHS